MKGCISIFIRSVSNIIIRFVITMVIMQNFIFWKVDYTSCVPIGFMYLCMYIRSIILTLFTWSKAIIWNKVFMFMYLETYTLALLSGCNTYYITLRHSTMFVQCDKDYRHNLTFLNMLWLLYFIFSKYIYTYIYID